MAFCYSLWIAQIWSTYVEVAEGDVKQEEDNADRTENFKKVVIVGALPGFRFYAQEIERGTNTGCELISMAFEYYSNLLRVLRFLMLKNLSSFT